MSHFSVLRPTAPDLCCDSMEAYMASLARRNQLVPSPPAPVQKTDYEIRVDLYRAARLELDRKCSVRPLVASLGSSAYHPTPREFSRSVPSLAACVAFVAREPVPAVISGRDPASAARPRSRASPLSLPMGSVFCSPRDVGAPVRRGSPLANLLSILPVAPEPSELLGPPDALLGEVPVRDMIPAYLSGLGPLRCCYIDDLSPLTNAKLSVCGMFGVKPAHLSVRWGTKPLSGTRSLRSLGFRAGDTLRLHAIGCGGVGGDDPGLKADSSRGNSPRLAAGPMGGVCPSFGGGVPRLEPGLGPCSVLSGLQGLPALASSCPPDPPVGWSTEGGPGPDLPASYGVPVPRECGAGLCGAFGEAGGGGGREVCSPSPLIPPSPAAPDYLMCTCLGRPGKLAFTSHDVSWCAEDDPLFCEVVRLDLILCVVCSPASCPDVRLDVLIGPPPGRRCEFQFTSPCAYADMCSVADFMVNLTRLGYSPNGLVGGKLATLPPDGVRTSPPFPVGDFGHSFDFPADDPGERVLRMSSFKSGVLAKYGVGWHGTIVVANHTLPVPRSRLQLAKEVLGVMKVGKWYPPGQVGRLLFNWNGRRVKEGEMNKVLQSLLSAAYIMQKILDWGIPQYSRPV